MTKNSTAMTALGVLTLSALATGCKTEGLGTGQVPCAYGNKTYQSGATFSSTDGCNTCSCGASGAVACTEMACLYDAGEIPPLPDAGATDTRPDASHGDMGGDANLGADAGNDARLVADAGNDARLGVETGNDAKLGFDAGGDGRLGAEVADSASDSAVTCLWQGSQVGIGHSVSDGCNTCSCANSGVMACTARACPNLDASAVSCLLPSTLDFGYSGGMVVYQDQYKLDPSPGMTITRSYGRGATDGSSVHTCAPVLPVCGTAGVVSVSTIVQDMADADVQAAFALATTPIYGVDQRPVDGAIWSISRASGGSLMVGSPCSSPATSSCRAIPAGVQRLADDLKSLAAAMAAQSACLGL